MMPARQQEPAGPLTQEGYLRQRPHEVGCDQRLLPAKQCSEGVRKRQPRLGRLRHRYEVFGCDFSANGETIEQVWPLSDLERRSTDRLFQETGIARRQDRQGVRSRPIRSEEHTSELQSLMRISYAVFCLKKKKTKTYTIKRIHASNN